jgi:hypothetical protein
LIEIKVLKNFFGHPEGEVGQSGGAFAHVISLSRFTNLCLHKFSGG